MILRRSGSGFVSETLMAVWESLLGSKVSIQE